MEKFWKDLEPNLLLGTLNPPVESLGRVLREHRAEIVICHPTFKNEDNIGRLLRNGILSALENFSEKRVAFVVSDGTCTSENPDSSTMDAAVNGVRDLFSRVRPEKILVAVTPYDGYRGNMVPGKGSALKLVYEELAFCDAKYAIILDGDLRNDMRSWHRTFRKVAENHFERNPANEMFVTARYARHFVDASLTRFVVGPLTTLMGIFVPGGISGDICLSSGAIALERGEWPEERLKYGTDISTTFDNMANPGSVIYEVYLGAKLHDITDEAKLSVMPGEVIGAALERILHYREKIVGVLESDTPLERPITWGPDKTGIDFIDPGYTDVFRIENKVNTLVKRWDEFCEDVKIVLGKTGFSELEREVKALEATAKNLKGPVRFLNFGMQKWVDCLYRGIGIVFREGNIAVVKRAFNYLYTAAFLEFCKDRLLDLGMETFEEVIRNQDHLGAPAENAKEFYEERVDREAFKLAEVFFSRRAKILEYM